MNWIAPRNVLSRTEAETDLSPYIPVFRTLLHQSWAWVNEFLDEAPDARLVCDSSIHAALVYRRFVLLLERELIGDPQVKVTRHGRMVTFQFGARIRLRFKKLNTLLRSMNVKTRQQDLMRYQLRIPGLDDRITDVIFGYVPDRLGRKVQGLYITCPKNWRENRWRIDIQDPMSGGMPLLLEPIADEPLPIITTKGKVRRVENG